MDSDYFTKWVEAIPTKHATEKVVINFLEDKIITHFGVPAKITTDNAKAFSSTEFSSFCFKYGIVLSHSSNYYPQGNGLAESSNKNLITIIKKIVGDNKQAWDGKIKYALWANRMTKKSSTGKSPFELVYGLDVTLPVHLRNEKPGNHGKFDCLWLGPYIIREAAGQNSDHLSTLDGEPLELPVNDPLLKLFYKEII
eukprot:PITA_14675